jgi:hypothetical protein
MLFSRVIRFHSRQHWRSGGKGRQTFREDRKSGCCGCGTGGRIEGRHDRCEREYGDCEERTGPRPNARGDFAPRQNQNEHRQNDGRKEASCRKLHHERGERRQDCQHPLHHQLAFVRAKPSGLQFRRNSNQALNERNRGWDEFPTLFSGGYRPAF